MLRSKIFCSVAWALFGSLSPFFIFFETYSLFTRGMPFDGIKAIPLIWLCFCTPLIFIIIFLSFLKSYKVGKLCLSLLLVFSIWSLKLTYLGDFSESNKLFKIIILVSIFASLYFLLSITNLSKARTPMFYLAFSFIIFIFVPYLVAGKQTNKEFPNTADEVILESLDDSDTKTTGNLAKFKSIQFQTRPNFYIFLYDSLIPPEAANIFFGKGTSGYETLISSSFIKPEGITLQNKVPSKPSIQSILWLDTEVTGRNFVYFNGLMDSPLKTVFRSNGYEITTGFTNPYWGLKTGNFIDKFLMLPKLKHSILCIENGSSFIDKLRGFGICDLLGNQSAFPNNLEAVRSFGKILASLVGLNQHQMISPSSPDNDWHELIENHVEKASQDRTPQLTFFYTYDPIGHTKSAYNHTNYSDRTEYKKRFVCQSNRAAIVIERIVELIKRMDNDAVVIVAGDHGTWISRGSGDPNFKTIDRHLVEIALLKTDNSCVKTHEREGFNPNRAGYHTVSSVILSVVSCLSNDPTLSLDLQTKFIEGIPSDIGLTEFINENLDDELVETFREDRLMWSQHYCGRLY